MADKTLHVNEYDTWQKYYNPTIHEYAKQFNLVKDGKPPEKDGIIKIFFTDMGLEKTINNLSKDGMTIDSFYQLNSHGMRCDEFIKNHNGEHVLFSGCSNTVGEAMFQEYTWPYLTYKKLCEEKKLSGYFNLSNPGFTIISIVWQLFSYFRNFGNPDRIFLNLPDVDREIRVIKSDDLENKPISDEFSGMLSYAYYRKLKKYCEENNIQLNAFTWDFYGQPNYTSIFDTREMFENFYRPTKEERDIYMYNFIENNKDHKHKEFLSIALDGAHPGIAEHDFMSNLAYKVYRGKEHD